MKFVFSSILALGCVTVVGCTGTTSESTESAESDVTAPSSAYTSLESSACTLTATGGDEPGGDWSEQVCPGMPGGWSLIVEYGDARNNVQVKHGDHAMNLDVWSRLPAFSHLGPKAEWRGPVKSPGVVDPYALIFRFFQTDGEGKESNYLVVSRITPTASCIVGLVDGGEANANVKAREMADAAKNHVCPSGEGPPPNATSIFTDMESCPLTEQGEAWSESACQGTGGYSLDVFEGDLREGVAVKTASSRTDLELYRIGGGGFSSVGPKADWRVHGPDRKVHGLMFRYREQLDESGRESNWLIVVKLAGDVACIYDIIDAKQHPNANVLAHVAADESYSKSCPATVPAAH